MSDAETLVSVARLLDNDRTNRMRSELRARVGTALKLPQKEHDKLDCIQNDQVFITFLPGNADLKGQLSKERLRPLLRQAIVAGCAAVETYVSDRTMELLGPVLRSPEKPPRLLELTMTVQQYLKVQAYQRKNWGLRDLIEDQVAIKASANPSSVGQLFSMVGIGKLWGAVDAERKVTKGSSERELDAIRQRRDKIAHTGDRLGRGRAPILIDEVERDLGRLVEIVDAIHRVSRK